MKNFVYILLLILLLSSNVQATTYTGGVTKVGQQESNQVIDAQTKRGVEFAKITMPQKNYRGYTDANGNFELPRIQITEPTIMNVEKEGYRPFSITINNNYSLSNPMHIEIAKSEPLDIEIDNEILHLGDNSYSKNSANATDFKLKSIGPYYSKEFLMKEILYYNRLYYRSGHKTCKINGAKPNKDSIFKPCRDIF